jgi:pSer/pThr/pTyr-binding forkhead associated (FHA) protein
MYNRILVMPVFIIEYEKQPVGTYTFDKNQISCGRAPDNTIVIANNAISRYHFKIEKKVDSYILTDLNSLNGTYIDGQKIHYTRIFDGNRITIGAYSITFHSKVPERLQRPNESEILNDRHEPEAERYNVSFPECPPEKTDMQTHKNVAMPTQNAMDALREENQEARDFEVQLPQQVKKTFASKQLDNRFKNPELLETAAIPRRIFNEQEGVPDQITLPVTQSIKEIILRHPLYSEDQILHELLNSDNEGENIGALKLHTLLKKLNLETRIKRYHFYLMT